MDVDSRSTRRSAKWAIATAVDALVSRQDRAVLAGERLSLEGVWLGPDDEVETLKPFLSVLPLIAVAVI